mmetsp:Transcript_68/g.90  ORF Transcript_68/g.90 Transcript_68/m.90 type:complete len:273 (+) Transcript_68:71-889(+)
MLNQILLFLALFSWFPDCTLAFHVAQSNHRYCSRALHVKGINRRDVFGAITITTSGIIAPSIVSADESVSTIEMKNFIDPVGYFAISIPKNFFTLRRTSKGDLPDPKTGMGRRGSSIFTAGEMSKAELVAVERYPTKVLLEENGIDASGDLSSFQSFGKPDAIANLINLHREKDKPGQSKTEITSASYSPDSKMLFFSLKSEIDVQKPELLMESYGLSRLFRITTAKASLNSNDGNMLVVFASALEKDFEGPDGVALQQSVDSFIPIDQSAA